MDVYQIVTDKILSLLEQGTVPWRKPWATNTELPKNLVSGKEYRGVNIFLLGCQQYSSPYWLTFKQAQDKGGSVRKGEKSTIAIFWKLLDRDETDKPEKVPLLRYYNVFNIEQCEGIPSPATELPTYDFTPIDKAEQIVKAFSNRPQISYGSNKAAYYPLTDTIRMPHEYHFQQSETFYSVLFHEMGHSTGHQSRLGRREVMERCEFGSEDYGSEELVAELTASMLCGIAGISTGTLELSASYIDNWLKVIRKDKKLIVTAAAQAQKAADHILGKSFVEEEP